MPRLGELLVAAKLLTPEQVEQALRAQVVWGGRFGTNLLELGFLDLDNLTRALGRQHKLPAALARHFDKADPDLQRRLEPEHADKWSIVPLIYVGPERQKVAIASMDPLRRAARAEIAAAMGLEPGALVVSIAAEQRMRYQLERVYGIARSARFLRAKGQNVTPFPEFGEVPVPVDSDPEIQVEVVPPDQPLEDAIPEAIPHQELSVPAPDQLAALIDEAIARVEPVASEEPSGRERRSYVKTLADVVAEQPKALGRIALKKLAPATIGNEPELPAGATFVDATRAIRRSSSRERVAELVIESLERFAMQCRAATLMVVRGEVVHGWKSFARGEHSVPELAVPTNQPGLVPASIERVATARAPASELQSIDSLLLSALGAEDGDLVVAPVAVAGRVMCLIAAAVETDTPVGAIEAVAAAASAAFARLIRDASR